MHRLWNMPKRLFWCRYALFAGALAAIAVAVLIYLECGFGSDSLTVLLEGLHKALGISIAGASAIYNSVIVAVGALYARRYMGWGSLLYSFQMVLFLAICERLIPLLRIPEQSLYLRVPIFLLGQALLSLGIALLMVAKLGMNSLDAILYQLSEQLRLPYFCLRTGSDFLFVVCGVLLGGAFGIGTVFSVLLTGYLIVFFRNQLEKHLSQKGFCEPSK